MRHSFQISVPSSNLTLFNSDLAEDLFRLVQRSRAITSGATIQILRQLYLDFLAPVSARTAAVHASNTPLRATSSILRTPTDRIVSPTTRLALLLTVFNPSELTHTTASGLKNKLEPLALGEIDRSDVIRILCHPFVEKYKGVVDFMRSEVLGSGEDTEEPDERTVDSDSDQSTGSKMIVVVRKRKTFGSNGTSEKGEEKREGKGKQRAVDTAGDDEEMERRRGLNRSEIRDIIEEVVERCLEIECKVRYSRCSFRFCQWFT